MARTQAKIRDAAKLSGLEIRLRDLEERERAAVDAAASATLRLKIEQVGRRIAEVKTAMRSEEAARLMWARE